MKQEFYKLDDRYIASTGESPKKFKGLLFVVFTGDTPDTVVESILSNDDLKDLEAVDAEDVPDEWRESFKKHGFKFEEESIKEPEEPVSGLAKDIKELQLQIEYEILKKKLEGIKNPPKESSPMSPSPSPKMEFWSIFNITVAVFIFAAIVLLLFI